jgi:formylglycine-generating enzyme required for sulfatase activity
MVQGRRGWAAGVILLVVGWTGCTGGEPMDSDGPTPAPTPPPTEEPMELEEPWVFVEGGSFQMGSDHPPDVAPELVRETPQHEVSVSSFAMMRHEVTGAMLGDCVDAGICTLNTGGNCLDPFDPANADRPANCLDWEGAGALCAFLGGRLPSESEWEYVATSGGQPVEFPWGDEPPDCERANPPAPDVTSSCGDGLWEVCSRPDGDSEWGFCDLAGNAFEWNQDWFWDDYSSHPTDGSAQEEMLFDFRVMRGGGVNSAVPPRVRQRTFHPPDFYYSGMGVRCAMDL